MTVAEDVLNGILPVRLTGHYIYCAPWDRIVRLRGVQSIYLDLALRPEFTHKIIRRFTEMNAAKVDQMDALGLFSCDIGSLHCTPSYSGELEAIRKEVRETAEACIRNGCPWDYTLKDISTVNYRIQNLTRWNEIVQKTLDEYY